MSAPELFLTNFNSRFTGVSATIANLLPHQSQHYDLRLIGKPLPLCPAPISAREARRLSRTAPKGRPFAIWHLRRDPEMQTAIWARDVLRLPIRCVFTSAAKHRHSAFPRWLISRMDAVIATSPEAASHLTHCAQIAPHGVDTARYRPAENRAQAWQELGFGGTEGAAIIGRIRPEKGTDIFVDAMIRACAERPGLTGLVIGLCKPKEQAFLDDLKARVRAAGLAERILFPGFIDHDTQPKLMRALSLLVNVARYEPFGVVPLEAMASGTPFVCSDTGYYRALSRNGQTGLITTPGSAEEASAAILELLSAPERHGEMARAGRRFVEAEHSTQREAAQIHEIYERLWQGERFGR